jgi:hypothetical protein
MRQYIEICGDISGEIRRTTYRQNLNDIYNLIAAVNEYCIIIGYEGVSAKLMNEDGSYTLYPHITPPPKLLKYCTKIKKGGK